MATFNFPYHTFETVYPESSTKIQFGRGYEYATAPKGPDQVEYKLHFEIMKFYLAPNGALDRLVHPTTNMATLEDFYLTHRLHTKFTYPHPLYGPVLCRFKAPLSFKLKPAGLGAVEPFTLEFILQP